MLSNISSICRINIFASILLDFS